jgi:hypothetical protein
MKKLRQQPVRLLKLRIIPDSRLAQWHASHLQQQVIGKLILQLLSQLKQQLMFQQLRNQLIQRLMQLLMLYR